MSAATPDSSNLPSSDVREWSLADRALLGACGQDVAGNLRIVEHLDESFDYAAAATDIALFPPNERPPESLRRRVTATLGRLSEASHPVAAPASIPPIPLNATDERSAPAAASTGRWGWIAAAAAIAIAVAAWWPVTEIDRATPDGSPALFRNALIADRSTAVVECACTEDPLCTGERACGDVVWNAERGEGYLRLVGIEPNDPDEFQYQLWIVDSTRDERYPVDGGVFDVPGDCGEVIVPIRASVPVGDAALFAVSVEKPGGTVVSDRRFVAVAPVG
ncbi:MAG: anti-sigma factor [Planctomycetota bacterium]